MDWRDSRLAHLLYYALVAFFLFWPRPHIITPWQNVAIDAVLTAVIAWGSTNVPAVHAAWGLTIQPSRLAERMVYCIEGMKSDENQSAAFGPRATRGYERCAVVDRL